MCDKNNLIFNFFTETLIVNDSFCCRSLIKVVNKARDEFQVRKQSQIFCLKKTKPSLLTSHDWTSSSDKCFLDKKNSLYASSTAGSVDDTLLLLL